MKGLKGLSGSQEDNTKKKEKTSQEHLSVESQEEEGADQPDPIQQPAKAQLEEEEQPAQFSLQQSDDIPPASSQKSWLQTLGLSPANLFIQDK